mmetsp:Transcript_10059/g.39161  ORF Transcript_10059/g.39161 Transcript_10059/m.39161 type:complete len:342 (+) Transcript_10059:31-1056(+)
MWTPAPRRPERARQTGVLGRQCLTRLATTVHQRGSRARPLPSYQASTRRRSRPPATPPSSVATLQRSSINWAGLCACWTTEQPARRASRSGGSPTAATRSCCNYSSGRTEARACASSSRPKTTGWSTWPDNKAAAWSGGSLQQRHDLAHDEAAAPWRQPCFTDSLFSRILFVPLVKLARRQATPSRATACLCALRPALQRLLSALGREAAPGSCQRPSLARHAIQKRSATHPAHEARTSEAESPGSEPSPNSSPRSDRGATHDGVVGNRQKSQRKSHSAEPPALRRQPAAAWSDPPLNTRQNSRPAECPAQSQAGGRMPAASSQQCAPPSSGGGDGRCARA